jgi:predicted dienelactone hydrolase
MDHRFGAEEWSKEKSAFVANPARWHEEYESFDALLDGLIQHATDPSLSA